MISFKPIQLSLIGQLLNKVEIPNAIKAIINTIRQDTSIFFYFIPFGLNLVLYAIQTTINQETAITQQAIKAGTEINAEPRKNAICNPTNGNKTIAVLGKISIARSASKNRCLSSRERFGRAMYREQINTP